MPVSPVTGDRATLAARIVGISAGATLFFFGLDAVIGRLGLTRPALLPQLIAFGALGLTHLYKAHCLKSPTLSDARLVVLLGLNLAASLAALATVEVVFLFPAIGASEVSLWLHRHNPRLLKPGAIMIAVGTAIALAIPFWIPQLIATGPALLIDVCMLPRCFSTMASAGRFVERRLAEAAAADLEIARRQQALQRAALHDYLTGLLNRPGLMGHLEQAAADAAPGAGTAVLFLDLDGFKAINDAHGHAVGDRALVAVAELFTAALSREDVLARTGGDEFVAIVTRMPDEASAAAVAERLRRCLDRPLHIDGRPLALGVSIGVAYTEAPQSPDVLLQGADARMYTQKASRQRSPASLA